MLTVPYRLSIGRIGAGDEHSRHHRYDNQGCQRAAVSGHEQRKYAYCGPSGYEGITAEALAEPPCLLVCQAPRGFHSDVFVVRYIPQPSAYEYKRKSGEKDCHLPYTVVYGVGVHLDTRYNGGADGVDGNRVKSATTAIVEFVISAAYFSAFFPL